MLGSQVASRKSHTIPFPAAQKKAGTKSAVEPMPVVLLYHGILLDDILAECMSETGKFKIRILRTTNEEQAARQIQELKPSKVVATKTANFSVEKLANILASTGSLDAVKIYSVSVTEDTLEIFNWRKTEQTRFMNFDHLFSVIAGR